jgi:hypothetical protein
MATTPKGIYYPTSSDNIAPLETHFSGLASSVDTALSKIQAGKTGTFTGPSAVGTSISPSAIVFPEEFSTIPNVSVTLVGGSSAVEGYSVVIHGVSTTQFTAKVFKTAGTAAETGLSLQWIAVEA